MKKYILIAIIALTGVISSCGNDFLRLYPHTDVVAGAPATRDIIEQNVTGVYQILLFDCYPFMPVFHFYDLLSDDFYVGGGDSGDTPSIQRVATFSATPSLTTNRWWEIFFAGLKRANGAFDAIDNAVSGTASQAWLDGRRAELLTLRAYYVHWLWKAYGNIPYFDEVWVQEPFIARQHSFDELYPILLADLDAAIATPEYVTLEDGQTVEVFPMTRGRGGIDRGRVHKAMAMMTRARIVMYKKDESRYAQVLQDMKTIIASPDYALVTTARTPNFTGLMGSNTAATSTNHTTNPIEWIFLRDGEFSSESIFEVTSNANNGKTWGNSWQGFGNYVPKSNSPRSGNNLRNVDNRFGDGWGFGPVRPDAYAIFEDGDYRKEASATNWAQLFADAGLTWNFADGFQNTGIYQRKYANRFGYNVGTGGDRDLNFENNKRIYRIAEAYLNAAELSFYAGNTADAQNYLNAVRDRAFGGDVSRRVPVSLNAIKLERRKEFFGEGMRFWDLLRWGSDENGRSLSDVLSTNDDYQQRTWIEAARFLPIPQGEINITASSQYPLKQNPGY